MNELVKEFDAIMDEACHESMTDECPNESAYRAASEWRTKSDGVRTKLEAILALARQYCHPGCNPGSHGLASQILRIAGERPERSE